MAGWFGSLKSLFLENAFTKISAVFISGSIGQKVSVVLGILGVVVGIWYALVPLLVSIAGLVIIQVAIKDYDKTKKDG